VDYRYEYYKEDNNRMTINTHSVYFEQKATDAITAKGELVYDGISGATPTGTHDASGKIKTTQVHDIRRSLSLQTDCRLGSQTITPGFAYSKESDYQSYGVSLNDAIDFNEKNTTLQFGVSQNFDNVRNGPTEKIWSDKYSTEGMVGITQDRELLPVATEVEILECQPLPDGRFYLEVIGRRRVRILSTEDQDGYRLARVELEVPGGTGRFRQSASRDALDAAAAGAEGEEPQREFPTQDLDALAMQLRGGAFSTLPEFSKRMMSVMMAVHREQLATDLAAEGTQPF
jgi:hypothetical protein